MTLIAMIDRGRNTATCRGIVYQGKGIDAALAFPLCRLLVSAGYGDQSVAFYDERGLAYTVNSLHAGARSMIAETRKGLRIVKYRPFAGPTVGATGPSDHTPGRGLPDHTQTPSAELSQ